LSHSPVISLPDTVTFGQQQSSARVCSSSQNSNSPDERHHAASSISPAMLQAVRLPTCKAVWPGDAHHLPSGPVQQQTVPPLILAKEQSHSQLLASDDLMSPHSLDAILNMPAMSFDSGQDMGLGLQPDTPQSQHMLTAAQQHLPDNTPHIQQHQLLPNEAIFQHCQNQHQHEQQSYQGHEEQQHYSSAHEQQHFSGGLQQQQQQQASCYGSGSQETGLQPLHFAPLDSHPNPGSSLHWADSCPVPTALPNVIRKTSSDSTIE